MATFNPEIVSRVHDGLDDCFLDWQPEWADSYRQYASSHDVGVVEWDGLLLSCVARELPSQPELINFVISHVLGCGTARSTLFAASTYSATVSFHLQ